MHNFQLMQTGTVSVGFFSVFCHEFEYTHLKINNGSFGIYNQSGHKNNIKNVILNNSDNCSVFLQGDFNTFSDNFVYANTNTGEKVAVNISDGNFNTIVSNYIRNKGADGEALLLHNNTHSVVNGNNTCYCAWEGITLTGSCFCNVSNNICNENDGVGLGLAKGSCNNIVNNNVALYNGRKVHPTSYWYNIAIGSIYDSGADECNYNTINNNICRSPATGKKPYCALVLDGNYNNASFNDLKGATAYEVVTLLDAGTGNIKTDNRT